MFDMQKTNDTELAILKSAEKEFMERGLAAARTTSIAAGAGVTHAMLHYYFRTKEALFETVIARKFAEMSALVFEVLQREDLDICKKLEMVMVEHFNFLMQSPQLPMVLLSGLKNNSTMFASTMGMLSNTFTKVVSLCQSQIQQAVERGEMRPVTIANIIIDIIGLNLSSVALAESFATVIGMPKEQFWAMRLEENKKTLLYRLKP